MIRNYWIKIFAEGGKTAKEFVVAETTPKRALKRLILAKFYKDDVILIGNIISVAEEKQWFYRATSKAYYEKAIEVTIRKLDYKYYGYIEHELYVGIETVGKIYIEGIEWKSWKTKSGRLPTDIGTRRTTDWSNLQLKTSFKNVISKFAKENSSSSSDFLITTGIDLNYFSSPLSFDSMSKTAKNLLREGKRVNLILYSLEFTVRTKPFTLNNRNPEELAKIYPTLVKIIRITKKDFEEVIVS